MRNSVKMAAALALAAGFGVLAASPLIAADPCRSYALNAARQGKMNEDKNCGFQTVSAPGQVAIIWSKNVKDHITWCKQVGPDEWQAALVKRQKDLAGCGK